MANKNKQIMKLIVVDADGEIIVATNGHVSSDNRELVRLVKREAALGSAIQIIAPFGEYVRANLDDPQDHIGITAALFSARPGRTRLLEAPAKVWDWLETSEDDDEGESFGPVHSSEEFHEALGRLEGFTNSDQLAKLLLETSDDEGKENK